MTAESQVDLGGCPSALNRLVGRARQEEWGGGGGSRQQTCIANNNNNNTIDHKVRIKYYLFL